MAPGARNKMAPPYFFVATHFCQKVDPLKTCPAKSDKQKKKKKKKKRISHISGTFLTHKIHLTVLPIMNSIGSIFIRPINVFFLGICKMVDHVFFTHGTILRPLEVAPGASAPPPFAPPPPATPLRMQEYRKCIFALKMHLRYSCSQAQ